MKERDDFNLQEISKPLSMVPDINYHLRPYASFEDASATRIDELRDDAADVEHRYTVGPKTCEDGLSQRKQNHAYSGQHIPILEDSRDTDRKKVRQGCSRVSPVLRQGRNGLVERNRIPKSP